MESEEIVAGYNKSDLEEIYVPIKITVLKGTDVKKLLEDMDGGYKIIEPIMKLSTDIVATNFRIYHNGDQIDYPNIANGNKMPFPEALIELLE